jgi:putative chitinase
MSEFTHKVGTNALIEVCPTLARRPRAEVEEIARALGTAMERLQPGMNPVAAAHFISQAAHESGEFKFVREIWGPTEVQKGYWRRLELQGAFPPPWPGLGFLARGFGYIQTTGRLNLRRAAKRLGFSSWRALIQAEGHKTAALTAMVWWADHFPAKMNTRDFTVERVTRTVNGGFNGLEERRRYFARAIRVRDRLQPRPIQ